MQKRQVQHAILKSPVTSQTVKAAERAHTTVRVQEQSDVTVNLQNMPDDLSTCKHSA